MKTRYIVAICSISFFLFLGCETRKTSDQNDNSQNNNLINIDDKDIQVISVKGQFEQPREDQSIFNVEVEFLNNTPNSFNSVELFAGIRADYKNENYPEYYPGPNDPELTDFEFLESILATQYDGLNTYRGEDNWLSGESRTFRFKIFYTYSFGWTEIGFSNSIFKRTPEKVSFILNYKFYGVDGEYHKFLGIDILEPWMDFQEQLGYRETD